MMRDEGLIVILSAPSGCGKDTVFNELCRLRGDCVESVSATTRSPRRGEENGVNYYFKTKSEFEQMIADNQLLEYACYNGFYYGTPIDGVKRAVSKGLVCFLIIEVQGAEKVMEMLPDAVSIFLLPPSRDDLYKRLSSRGTDSPEMIEKRMSIADFELAHADSYKYQVVNDDLDKAVSEINEIIDNELQKRSK
ncbi:MAG: guanylate kinase [Eubacterium sp.]